ncbi:MAG: FAD-binding protein, partial [Dehalococcoidia bacterium]|nr:FAD-binding protein [Dehalococcoidia bacterium]
QALLVGMGAKFINKNGERFMLRYDPEMAEKSKLSTLVQAFANEALQNRGPCYWDMTGFSEEDIAMVRRLLPTTLRPYDELNIDIRKKPVECSPIVQICSSCGEGGIRIDISCRSSVEGLYAAGAAARNPVHGVYSVGGVNLAFCNVAGYRAGETAARSVAKNPDKEIILNQAKVTLKNNFTPLGRKEGFTPDDVVKEFQNIVIPAKVSILKNESRINETLNKLKVLKETKLAAMAAKDIHELVKALEAQNLVEIAEIVFLAALQRKESRAWHFREEYPDRNDKEWLKWVIAQKGNDGKTKFRIENIPVENYEFRIANPGSSPHPLTLGNKK